MLTIQTRPSFLPEKTYLFQVLFSEWLGIPFQIQPSETEHYHLLLPNGASLTVEDHFFGKIPGGEHYLSEAFLPKQVLFWENGPFPHSTRTPILYGIAQLEQNGPHSAILRADLFAAIFFMLTRWEETIASARDQHGRFPAKASLAGQLELLTFPLADIWTSFFPTMFRQLGWLDLPEKKHLFRLQLSCDVDHPRLWWHWPERWRTLVACFLKKQSLQEASFWLKNHFFSKKDPFDTFDWLMELGEQAGVRVHFNFLGKRARHSDAFYPLEHPFVLDLIKKIAARGHVIGFHPSYESFDDPVLFASELASLRAVSPLSVETGRQHYLRFSVPETWQVWENNQMKWDSSLGYAEMEGFRCGTAREFPVFDVRSRQMLRLREKPLVAMDVTLAIYRHLSPEQVAEKLAALSKQVRIYGGDFTLLWHNSSLQTHFWQAYRGVFRDFVQNSRI